MTIKQSKIGAIHSLPIFGKNLYFQMTQLLLLTRYNRTVKMKFRM
jgi:hypothetical protein